MHHHANLPYLLNRLEKHRGFAMAVKDALEFVTTPYVMIIQHDRMLGRSFDVSQVLKLMRENPEEIKYVGLSTSGSEGQANQVSSRYRIDVATTTMMLDYDPNEPDDLFKSRLMSNRPPSLPKALDFLLSSGSGGIGVAGAPGHRTFRRMLVPLIFWYDSTHIASVEHYKNFVFGLHRLKGVTNFAQEFRLNAGDFVEDKLGQAEREDIKINGLQEHRKYGTYLLEDLAGPFVFHCHGRLMGTSSARTYEIYFGEEEEDGGAGSDGLMASRRCR